MFFVWSQKRINVKLAYWGPADSGKTTAVHALAGEVARRVDSADIPERASRQALGMRRNAQPVEIDESEVRFTTYFCHPPGAIGEFSGYPVHYQCKTVEQPLEGNLAVEKVLDGISGVVFVADASRERQAANEDALRDLVVRLSRRYEVEAGATSSLVEQLFGDDGPLRLVLQVNKSDVDAAIGAEQVRRGLMLPQWVEVVDSVATEGEGVYEAFEAMGDKLRPLLEQAQQRGRIPNE
jgi:signal recognition particle receptor subunit beta